MWNHGLRKLEWVNISMKTIGNNGSSCWKSVNPWRIMLIFELERDIHGIMLCRKFHDNRTIPSKVIVYTAGRPDILTDSRVYSLFEYTIKKIYLDLYYLISHISSLMIRFTLYYVKLEKSKRFTFKVIFHWIRRYVYKLLWMHWYWAPSFWRCWRFESSLNARAILFVRSSVCSLSQPKIIVLELVIEK
jgi:hypothetical protein